MAAKRRKAEPESKFKQFFGRFTMTHGVIVLAVGLVALGINTGRSVVTIADLDKASKLLSGQIEEVEEAASTAIATNRFILNQQIQDFRDAQTRAEIERDHAKHPKDKEKYQRAIDFYEKKIKRYEKLLEGTKK